MYIIFYGSNIQLWFEQFINIFTAIYRKMLSNQAKVKRTKTYHTLKQTAQTYAWRNNLKHKNLIVIYAIIMFKEL